MAVKKRMLSIKNIKKRDGRIVPFNEKKILLAIVKAMRSVGEPDQKRAEEMTGQVVEILEGRFDGHTVPEVEQIQDVVEEILIKNRLVAVAKSFILYRELHRKLRNINSLIDSDELVHNYIDKLDWRVKENSNMTYSLQGLNNHVASLISSNFWLNQIYSKEMEEAHLSGDLHLHDLAILAVYCCGWDLRDFLLKGFSGVPGKISCKPPKHLRTALGQLVNLIYTLQGEIAGAQAVSNFDILLAPFIFYDKLSYKEVKQSLQEFMFNMNVPTRVGFQCLSEDTEILTAEGWRNYQEVKEGDKIKTFNLNNKKIEIQEVTSVFKRKYKGVMYNLQNRIQDQLLSPGHRVVRKKFNTENFILEPIEEAIKLKSPLIIPLSGENTNKKVELSDEQIKLMAWIISEGTIERPTKYRCCYRVSIYQSKNNKTNCEEIRNLLSHFDLEYYQYESASLGNSVWRARLSADSSKKIHEWFGTKENVHFLPEILLNMDRYQSKLFLETYLKADGFEGCKMTTTDTEVLDGLEQLIVNCGYGFTVLARKPTIGKKEFFVLRIILHPETSIARIKQIDYEGIIWCPHTINETVIARRKGKVFITGNTPFSNITLDFVIPGDMAKEPVIIGGERQKKTYGDFQKEVNIFNQALGEVFLEGDAQGRVFSFPIPTINITKDFDWENPYLENLWEATRKYGIPYFSNFVNSDMKPEDVRSMCCRLRLNNKELVRKGGGLFGANPLTGCYDEKTEILTQDGWKFFKQLTKEDEIFTLTETNKIEEHKPVKLFEYDYEGDMFQFSTRSIDLLVTPNHQMVVDQIGSGIRKFVEAKDFDSNNQRIPKKGIWLGKESQWFFLPRIEFTKYGNEGKTSYKVLKDTLKIKMDEWLKFFGFWIAEGSADNEKIAQNRGYRTFITQVNEIKGKEIETVLNRLPFNYTKENNNYVICNKQLWIFLHQFGKKYDKFIPKEIKVLSKRQLKILFDWMVKGDGHVRKTTGQINYWTSSKRLADDLQEIILKLGWLGTITLEKGGEAEIKGRKIKSNDIYTLGVQKAIHYRLRKNNIKVVSYKGKVYCCEVENHTVFVRRNGRVTWCGNSIGVVTINLPRIGYLTKTKKEFKDRLAYLMDLAKESLIIKRKVLEDFTNKGLYPYSRYYLEAIKKRFGGYWKNHFNTIGLVGMNEACLNFLGENIATKKGKEFALEILDFMREKVGQYQLETNQLFNLEATPAEGTSYRFAREDRKRYQNIIFANSEAVKNKKAEPYYTNSTQLPVDHTTDIFEALSHQDELQCKYTGGTVFHGFLGESLPDIQSLKTAVKKIAEKFHLPYFTFTPTFSICEKHGYLAGGQQFCPKCDVELSEQKNKLEKEGFKVIIE